MAKELKVPSLDDMRRAFNVCPPHNWIFDDMFSFENGEGELEICTGCGQRRRVEHETV